MNLNPALIVIALILFLSVLILISLFMLSNNKNKELSEELTLLRAAKALDEQEIQKLSRSIEKLQFDLDSYMILKARNEREIDDLKSQIEELNSKYSNRGS